MEYLSNLIFEATEESQDVKLFIDDVLEKIKFHLENNKETFSNEIVKNINNANLNDAQEIFHCEGSIVEFESEPSRDFIPIIINDSIRNKNILIENFPISILNIFQEPETIMNIAEQNTIVTYTNTEGFAFSMNRLAPGYLLFTSSFSFSLNDEKEIEFEPVRGTAIFINLVYSLEDVKHQSTFNTSLADKEYYLKLKREQSDLLIKLTSEEIDFDTWLKLDNKYKELVAKAKMKLDGRN